METSDTIIDPRNRGQFHKTCFAIFGAKVELIRASAIARDERFVIAMPTRLDGRNTTVILGTGADWQHAFERAMTSDTGKAAIEAWTEFLNKTKKDNNNDDHSERSEAAESEGPDDAGGGNHHDGA